MESWDIVIANGGGGMTVLQGNGNTSFRGPINYLAGHEFIAVADFNSDNKPDVAGRHFCSQYSAQSDRSFQISGGIADASDFIGLKRQRSSDRRNSCIH